MPEERRRFFEFERFVCRCGGTVAAADRLGTSLANVVLWHTGYEPVPFTVAAAISAGVRVDQAAG